MAEQEGSSFKKALPPGELTPEGRAFHEGVQEGLKMGKRDGQMEERANLLNFLERRYLSGDVTRGSEKGDALLKVARQVAEYYRQNPIGGGA